MERDQRRIEFVLLRVFFTCTPCLVSLRNSRSSQVRKEGKKKRKEGKAPRSSRFWLESCLLRFFHSLRVVPEAINDHLSSFLTFFSPSFALSVFRSVRAATVSAAAATGAVARPCVIFLICLRFAFILSHPFSFSFSSFRARRWLRRTRRPSFAAYGLFVQVWFLRHFLSSTRFSFP